MVDYIRNNPTETIRIMQITKTIRRTIASVLLTAGLVYPACAAVCPKGIGGCSSPGRCFLFVDADGNSLCDYTARTVSQAISGPVSSGPTAPVNLRAPVEATSTPVANPVSVTVNPAPASTASVTSVTVSPDTGASVIPDSSTASILDTLHVSAPVAEAILFLLFAGIFFALIRTGILGIRIEKTLPALALSSLFALGLSLVATSFLAGGAIAGTTFALCFMAGGTLLAAYLWCVGVMTQRTVFLAAALSTLTGFAFLSPIMPMELGGIVNVVTGGSALNLGIIVICGVIAVTLIVGRTFCGSICPVGSLQELAYAIPLTKITIRHTIFLELIRLVIFIATVLAAVFLIDTMEYTGLYDLFSLTLSAVFVIAAALILVSVFLYRPVCRILCPFGVLFSLLGEFSVFRLQRTESCIGCKKCEKACPSNTAGKLDSKGECYLCGRCTETCQVTGALAYTRQSTVRKQ
ncbi:MAG: 4Fe-4S binding protein [Methanoregula sp.]|nr:4Fe-4S binding protein [Methanoregula sp.]